MKQLKQVNKPKRVSSEGLPEVEGNKETLAKCRREQENIFFNSLFLGNRGTN